jgi:hypothetical protein
MKIELQERYRNILISQCEEGLDLLEKLNVKDKSYQMLVVNINNANNIAYQLGVEIENQKKALAQAAETPAEKPKKAAKKSK